MNLPASRSSTTATVFAAALVAIPASLPNPRSPQRSFCGALLLDQMRIPAPPFPACAPHLRRCLKRERRRTAGSRTARPRVGPLRALWPPDNLTSRPSGRVAIGPIGLLATQRPGHLAARRLGPPISLQPNQSGLLVCWPPVHSPFRPAAAHTPKSHTRAPANMS